MNYPIRMQIIQSHKNLFNKLLDYGLFENAILEQHLFNASSGHMLHANVEIILFLFAPIIFHNARIF